MNSVEERKLFEEFKQARTLKKHEEECKAAEEARVKEAERGLEIAQAISSFHAYVEKNYGPLYEEPDSIIYSLGKSLKKGKCIEFPHCIIKEWREARYRNRGINAWNMGSTNFHPSTPQAQGREWDGLPLYDEADKAAGDILIEEKNKYESFCIRLSNRIDKNI